MILRLGSSWRRRKSNNMILLPVNMFVNMPVNIFTFPILLSVYKAVLVLGHEINIITTTTMGYPLLRSIPREW